MLITRSLTSFQSNFPTGFSIFLSYGDLLHGASISTSRSLQFSAPVGQTPGLNDAPNYHVYEPSGFVQDDWRVNSKLTLNLGVRYDLFTPFREKNNLIANFDPDHRPGNHCRAGRLQQTRPGLGQDYNGLAPRFGFALVSA